MDKLHEGPAKGPLAGYKVLEFAANYTAPFGSMLLGDQGADVIKVEALTGDQMRYSTSARNGVASAYVNGNRNKRGISLNMKDPRSVEIFKKLAAQSDVVIQNFRPGAMERMGLGYEDLKKIKDDIIMVSVSGFGSEGPNAGRKAYDTIFQGYAGIADAQRDGETGVPALFNTMIIDKVTAMHVWQASTAALLHRERTGKGQLVEIDMFSAGLGFMWPDMMMNNTFVGEGTTQGQKYSDIKLLYKTKDDYIVVVYANHREFSDLVTAVGKADMLKDERFSTMPALIRNYPAVYQNLKHAFEPKTTAEWMKILIDVDCIAGPVNSSANMHLDDHVVDRKLISDFDHPVLGHYRQAAPAVKFRETPPSIRLHPPMLGEHTAEVLSELGYKSDEISKLCDEGAVKCWETKKEAVS